MIKLRVIVSIFVLALAPSLLFAAGSWDTDAESVGSGNYKTITIGPTGTTYVAFQDETQNNKLTVKKRVDGEWSVVGSAGISNDSVGEVAVAEDYLSHVWVAYHELNNTGRLLLKQWDGSQWNTISTTALQEGTDGINRMSIKASNGRVFIAYADESSATPIRVYEYIVASDTWVDMDSQSIESAPKSISKLLLGASVGKVFISYATSDGVFIRGWTGTTWTSAAQGVVSQTQNPFAMTVDPRGVALVFRPGYRSWGNSPGYGYLGTEYVLNNGALTAVQRNTQISMLGTRASASKSRI